MARKPRRTLLDIQAPSSARGTSALASSQRQDGRIALGKHVLSVQHTAEGGVIRLTSPGGAQPLIIEVTGGGSVLRLGEGLSIEVSGRLDIAADELSLSARRDLKIRSGGAMELQAAGDMSMDAEAHSVSARLGDVKIKANDDVAMAGERILMNC